MSKIKHVVWLFTLAVCVVSCKQQQARRPISRSSGTFLSESIERNKKMIKGEEAKIDSIIKSNPQYQYIASTKGYWYHYETKNETDTLRPKKGDVANFTYEVKDLKGNVIYSEVELKPQTYVVDKQNIMSGLRLGIKQMRKNEKVTFLFPSHLAYGYHGDNNKIGTNVPLICTVNLIGFKPETAANPSTQQPKTTTE